WVSRSLLLAQSTFRISNWDSHHLLTNFLTATTTQASTAATMSSTTILNSMSLCLSMRPRHLRTTRGIPRTSRVAWYT
ncbi:hypothetical protein BGZ92_001790, partial [Podila epicladia]